MFYLPGSAFYQLGFGAFAVCKPFISAQKWIGYNFDHTSLIDINNNILRCAVSPDWSTQPITKQRTKTIETLQEWDCYIKFLYMANSIIVSIHKYSLMNAMSIWQIPVQVKL